MRRANIDLTPLLDIILLLVFGFMFVIASTNTQLINKQDDLAEKQVQLEAKETELLEQTESNEQISNDLNNIIADYNNQIAILEAKNESNNQQIDQLKSSMQNYFDLNKDELTKMMAESEIDSSADTLNNYSDKYKTAYSVVMYELLSNEFYFVDVVLVGETNRVMINNKLTPVTISIDDMQSFSSRNSKIDEIKNQISQVIDERVGGSSMTFVTLSNDNGAILHYAWSTAWDSIKKLEEKYGAKNYYCAELFINQED